MNCQTGKIRVKVSSGWSHHKARDVVIRGRLSWERSIVGYKPIVCDLQNGFYLSQ